MTNSFVHDPEAVLDYQWDWTDWLAVGETITAHTITAETGLTLGAHTNTTTTVTAWISGGTVGQRYKITCHVTSDAGRQDDRTIVLMVEER